MLTIYKRWEDVPNGLMTRTQLKAEGLKPAPEQMPVARISGQRDVYDLYDKAGAVPVRVLSEAQKAAALTNIEKARDALACVDCGRWAMSGRKHVDGRCADCTFEYRQRNQALARLREWAGRGDWLVVDTETTGLGNDDEVISVAVVSATGEVLFSEMVRPTQRIHPKASAVNGITDEMVVAALPFAEVYSRLVEVLAGRLVLAYNAEFDQRMLRQTCERYGLPVIRAEWECVMDLYAAARTRWSRRNGFVWCKLGEACQSEGVQVDGFHEAYADAQATRLLVLAVGKEISDAIQSAGNAD
ncbi:MAG: 3'-5' exonuclease [Chloroflexi bacterium]|nr:3'-5' exonuclease [Chloroflexota bacterium]